MFGSISLHSLGLFYPNYRRDELQGVYEKYGDGKELKLDKHDINSIPDYERNIILTDIHEIDHFNQLISSPFGILLFRTYQALMLDVIWIGKQFAMQGLKVTNHRSHLVDWLKKEGITKLSAAIKQGSDKDWVPYYLEVEVIPGIKALEKLLSLLTSKTLPTEFEDLTAQGFCEILNDANLYLRKRCDIDIEYKDETFKGWKDTGFVWKTNLLPNTKVFNKEFVFKSPGNIMESIAYLHEYRLLERSNANKSTITQWYEKRVPDYCRNIVIHFLKHFNGDPSSARGFLTTYLEANLDIATGISNQRERLVEDEWSFFMGKNGRNMEDEYLFKINNSISGFQSLLNRKKLFGTRSNWRKIDKPEHAPAYYSEHLLRIESSFLKAIERKLSLKKDQLMGKRGKLQLDDLILIFESSNDFNIKYFDPAKIGENLYLLTYIYPTFYSTLPATALRILNGLPVLYSEKRPQKLITSLKNLFGPNLSENALNEIKGPIENLFKKDHIAKTFTGIDLLWYLEA